MHSAGHTRTLCETAQGGILRPLPDDQERGFG